MLLTTVDKIALHDKVYGLTDNDGDKIVLRYTGEKTALSVQFYYLKDTPKGVQKFYRFLVPSVELAPYKDGWTVISKIK